MLILSASKSDSVDYLLEYTKDIEGDYNVVELSADFPTVRPDYLVQIIMMLSSLYFDSVVLDEPADFPACVLTVIRPSLVTDKVKQHLYTHQRKK